MGRKIRVMNKMLNTCAKCAKLKSINTKGATARLNTGINEATVKSDTLSVIIL